jgi:hypothetical protein
MSPLVAHIVTATLAALFIVAIGFVSPLIRKPLGSLATVIIGLVLVGLAYQLATGLLHIANGVGIWGIVLAGSICIFFVGEAHRERYPMSRVAIVERGEE